MILLKFKNWYISQFSRYNYQDSLSYFRQVSRNYISSAAGSATLNFDLYMDPCMIPIMHLFTAILPKYKCPLPATHQSLHPFMYFLQFYAKMTFYPIRLFESAITISHSLKQTNWLSWVPSLICPSRALSFNWLFWVSCIVACINKFTEFDFTGLNFQAKFTVRFSCWECSHINSGLGQRCQCSHII